MSESSSTEEEYQLVGEGAVNDQEKDGLDALMSLADAAETTGPDEAEQKKRQRAVSSASVKLEPPRRIVKKMNVGSRRPGAMMSHPQVVMFFKKKLFYYNSPEI